MTMYQSQLRKIALLLSVFWVALSACSLTQFIPLWTESTAVLDEDNDFEAAVRAALEENVRASEEEDLEAYMAGIHPDTPQELYDQTESLMVTIFENYDLEYSIEIGAITLMENGDARVEFVLTTTKLRGPEFRDNEVTGIFYLRLDDGMWKFVNQEITNIRYLD